MGRNKIKIEKIKNERIRQVTFYKRKRGLLKKAMELSLLCGVKVFLGIVDKNEKVMIFSSEKEITALLTHYMYNYELAREVYTHDDYKEIFEENARLSEYSDYKGKNSDKEDDFSDDFKSDGSDARSKKKTKKKSKFFNDKSNASIELANKNKNDLKEIKQESSLAGSSIEISVDKDTDTGIKKIKNKLSLKVFIPGSKVNIADQNNILSKESEKVIKK